MQRQFQDGGKCLLYQSVPPLTARAKPTLPRHLHPIWGRKKFAKEIKEKQRRKPRWNRLIQPVACWPYYLSSVHLYIHFFVNLSQPNIYIKHSLLGFHLIDNARIQHDRIPGTELQIEWLPLLRMLWCWCSRLIPWNCWPLLDNLAELSTATQQFSWIVEESSTISQNCWVH